MTSGLRISDIAHSTGIGIQTKTKTMENKTIDNLIVCSLNCEGINHSKDFINNFLTDNACDILCLQETWTIDSNINILGNMSAIEICISNVNQWNVCQYTLFNIYMAVEYRFTLCTVLLFTITYRICVMD